MKFNILTLLVFATLILGCGTTSAIKHNGKDLFIHYYTSDSLGVEKSVFAKNEPINISCVIKNVSNHPIKYSYTGNPTYFVNALIQNLDGTEIVRILDFHPNPIWKESALNPEDQLSFFYKYSEEYQYPPGKYYAEFRFSIVFEPKYNKTFSRLNRQVYFKIEKE